MDTNYFITKISESLTYMPNDEQAEAIAHLSRYVCGNDADTAFLLIGHAGTGKTSLTGALVKALASVRIPVVLLAPTGRAAKVFSHYSAHQAFTIHRKIYRQGSFTGESHAFTLADNRHTDTVFIIDEASMISNSDSDSSMFSGAHLLDDLVHYVFSGINCKLILLGDTAQLPPVGQTASPALNKDVLQGYGLDVRMQTLTHTARQSEYSGILRNAVAFRKNMDMSPLPIPTIQSSLYDDVIPVIGGDELIDAITGCYDKDGMEDTIIITRSNKRAVIFNNGVRNQILYYDDILVAGDYVLVAKNNYFWTQKVDGIDFIANGDVARVQRVSHKTEMYGMHFADVTLYFADYDIEVDAKIVLDALQSESPALTREQQTSLYTQVLEDTGYMATKRDAVRALKTDPWFNALQVKYAYSVTCHKAQGGQWKNVFVDLGYIAEGSMNIDFYRWLYTATTRATTRLYFINPAIPVE